MALLVLAAHSTTAGAVVFLDEDRAVQVTLKTYTQARFLAQEPEGFRKGYTLLDLRDPQSPQQTFVPTFDMEAYSLLQNRYYLEPQLNIDMSKRGSVTPSLQMLDERLAIDQVKFFFGVRVEYDGIYDYGPKLFTDTIPEPVRNNLRQKSRIHEVYGDFRAFRHLNVRIGKQNLSWGEADVFRILDIINPLDQTFGGFLTPLDERRVPSVMLKGSYDVGSAGPVYNVALEGFYEPLPALTPGPTVPQEGPWSVITGPPSPLSLRLLSKNRWDDARTGGRLLFNAGDMSYTTAHYWTYPESPTPRLAFDTSLTKQIKTAISSTAPIIDKEYPKGTPFLELAYPKIMITGATVSGPVPFSPYTILRGETALLYDHPYFLPETNIPLLAPTFELDETRRVDPVALTDVLARQKAVLESGREGTLPRSDVVKWALGADHNQWIRALNPRQTFFISAQVIGEHWADLQKGASFSVQEDAFVARLTVPGKGDQTLSQPRFVRMKVNGYKSTFLIQTGYTLGRGYLAPSFATIAEYGEFDSLSYLLQPAVEYLIAPFKFRFEYDRIAGAYSGIGFLRDRDNFMIRMDLFIDQIAEYWRREKTP